MVCYELIGPIVRQCTQGHIYCDSCYKRMKCCPMCRSVHLENEETLMSSLRRFLPLPCKQREKGCLAMVLGNDLEEHERTCPVTWKRCPFSSAGMCTWSGPGEDAVIHCLEVHSDKLLVGHTLEYTWRFLSGGLKKVEHVMLAHGRLFVWRLCVEKKTDRITWTCDPLVEGKQTGIRSNVLVKAKGFLVQKEIAMVACGLQGPPKSVSWCEMYGSFSACRLYAKEEGLTFVFKLTKM